MHGRWATDAPMALGRIPTDDAEGVDALTVAARSQIDALEQSKWPRALQWFENASYLQGNHLTRFYYDSFSGGLGLHIFGVHDSSRYDKMIAKTADNRLIRPVETVVSMLTESKPMPRVEPNSELPDDEDAAALSEIVLQLVFEKPLQMPTKLDELAMTACICGTGIIEVEYGETDYPVETLKTKIKEIENPLFEEEEGQPKKIPVEVEDGTEITFRKDLMARCWTPYHITPDPGATDPDNMQWVSRQTFEDIDWIVENFAQEGEGYFFSDEEELRDKIQIETASRHVLYWWSKVQDIIETPQLYHAGGLAPPHFLNASGSLPNQTLFQVIDVKPTPQFTSGRTLIFAGHTLIYAGPARAWSERYPWRWHPYAFFSWFKVPGKFWGVPLLTEILPHQKRINAIDALVQANREYMAIGQWLIPKHAKIAEGRLSGLIGEHFTYNDVPGMHPPEKVRNEPLPAELMQEKHDLIQAIDFIAASGVIDGQSIAKSAARSGVILDFLRKEKMRSKTPMIKRFEKMLETVAQNVLIELQLNLNEDDPELTQRVAAAAREKSSLTINSFVGASLRDHHSVKIDIATELRHSPEAREARALEFYQFSQGQVTPDERQGIINAIGLDRFVKSEEGASVQRARRMIARIRTGQLEQVTPMPGIDNPKAMAPIFQNEILSDRFNDYDKKSKEFLFQLFDHYSQAAAALAQQEFQMQLMLAQGGGGKGQQPQQPQESEE